MQNAKQIWQLFKKIDSSICLRENATIKHANPKQINVSGLILTAVKKKSTVILPRRDGSNNRNLLPIKIDTIEGSSYAF